MTYAQTRLTPLEESKALIDAGIDPDIETWNDETLARALYGRMGKDDYLVANALSWFAAEEVARFETDK
jgi:hypothetical protein